MRTNTLRGGLGRGRSAVLIVSLLTIAAIGMLQALPCFAANADDFTSAEPSQAPGPASKSDDAVRVRVIGAFGKLPLSFEANRGQTDSQVRFLSRGPQHTLLLAPTEAVLIFITREHPEGVEGQATKAKLAKPRPATRTALRMTFLGANPDARVTGREELPGKANYFIGNDPAGWRTNVPTYARVHYEDLYPGIDLVYYGNQRQLEYDFVVRPGADPRRIALGFRGAQRLEVDPQGDLVLHTAAGAIRQRKPIIYQEVAGRRVEIPGDYVLRDGQRVGFHVAAYDTSLPLIIDPVLSYSTYLGGMEFDEGRGITVDATTGEAYVTGFTNSFDFPTIAGSFQTAFAQGNGDAFVTKLNATGSALVYSTYLGGNGADEGRGIAIDSIGQAYVTGITGSSNFPTTPGAYQTVTGGGSEGTFDAFVTKLNFDGSMLLYSTYLGGNGSDQGNGIAVDTSGNAYVTGFTGSTNFPATAGPFGPGGGGDAFVTALNPTGTAPLVFSTYLGGTGGDMGMGITVDAMSSPNAYVVGITQSTDFPTTAGAFDTMFNGGFDDAFVAKIAGIVPGPPGGQETVSKVSGGGFITVGLSGKGTFGLEAHRKTLNDPVHGTVEYQNHLTGAALHGIVNSLSVDQTTRTFHLAGTCRSGSSCAVFQVDGQDVAEPGKNADKFTIRYCTIAGPPAAGCTTDGAPPNNVIVRGNLQVH